MKGVVPTLAKALASLGRAPQLFAFPALCWIAGLVLQALFGGTLTSAAPGGSSFPAAFGFVSLAAAIVELMAAYFSAGQIKGLLLANSGEILTLKQFSEAYNKYGGRVLSAKLLRVGMLIGVGIFGAALVIVLRALGSWLALLLAAAVLAITLFWEVIIVADDAQVQPALAETYRLLATNPLRVLLPVAIVAVGQMIIVGILRLLPGIGVFLSTLFDQVLMRPFFGLVIVSLYQELKAALPEAEVTSADPA